ncbi:PAAR domain-containing protein [Klebsiella pneumoniae]
MAGKGNMVLCPKCKGAFPIIEGSSTYRVNGVPFALDGMKTACGASLIASTSRGSPSLKPRNCDESARNGHQSPCLLSPLSTRAAALIRPYSCTSPCVGRCEATCQITLKAPATFLLPMG